MMAYYIGQGEIANSLLRSWNELKADKEKGSKRGRLEAITESREDNQGDEKTGKMYTGRSSKERKKEGKPAHFGAHIKKNKI